MIAVNKNLANLNMYDTTAMMFNDGVEMTTPFMTSKVIQYGNMSVQPNDTGCIFGVKNNMNTVLGVFSNSNWYNSVWYNTGSLTISKTGETISKTTFSNGHGVATYTSSLINGILKFSIGGKTLSLDVSEYDCVFFNDLNYMSDVKDCVLYNGIYQSYYIINQHGKNFLEKINKELYSDNTNIKGMLNSFKQLDLSLSNVKTYMYSNNLITYDESESIFYKLNSPNIRVIKDINARVINLISATPFTLTPPLLHNGTDTLYLVHITKNFDLDSPLIEFYNYNSNKKISQMVYGIFNVGLPTDDTADIKLDYINRIDTIDALKISIKHSNIIN